MTRSVRYGAATMAVLSLVLVGCGSSSDDSSSDTTAASAPEATTTTSATDDFVAQLDELCATGRAATDAAGTDFETAISDIQVATDSGDDAAYAVALDAAETSMEAVIGAVDDFDAAVDQLDVPADAEAALADYVDALDQSKALAQDVRDAIAADDGAAFTDATAAIDAAGDQLDAQRADAAEALGADACVPDSSTDSSTDTTVG